MTYFIGAIKQDLHVNDMVMRFYDSEASVDT